METTAVAKPRLFSGLRDTILYAVSHPRITELFVGDSTYKPIRYSALPDQHQTEEGKQLVNVINAYVNQQTSRDPRGVANEAFHYLLDEDIVGPAYDALCAVGNAANTARGYARFLHNNTLGVVGVLGGMATFSQAADTPISFIDAQALPNDQQMGLAIAGPSISLGIGAVLGNFLASRHQRKKMEQALYDTLSEVDADTQLLQPLPSEYSTI